MDALIGSIKRQARIENIYAYFNEKSQYVDRIDEIVMKITSTGYLPDNGEAWELFSRSWRITGDESYGEREHTIRWHYCLKPDGAFVVKETESEVRYYRNRDGLSSIDEDKETVKIATCSLDNLMLESDFKVRGKNYGQMSEWTDSIKAIRNYNFSEQSILRVGTKKGQALYDRLVELYDFVLDTPQRLEKEAKRKAEEDARRKAELEAKQKAEKEAALEAQRQALADALRQAAEKAEKQKIKETLATEKTSLKALLTAEGMDSFSKGTSLVQNSLNLIDALCGGRENVSFGIYENVFDTQSPHERRPIKWLVLKREGYKMLLVSKYIVDKKPYNSNLNSWASWKDCYLNNWLNTDFYNSAFRDCIDIVVNTDAETQRVFVLSADEVASYFGFGKEAVCTYPPRKHEQNAGDWWLRMDRVKALATAYTQMGDINRYKSSQKPSGIRPAIWVDLENISVKTEILLHKIKDSENEIRRKIIEKNIAAGRCQYCGGEFKGLFSKKCFRCGRRKDY